jgi:tetratricopeptide (TPR) repeat protein
MSLEIWLRHLGLLAWPLNLSAFYLVSPAGPSWSCLASGSALVLLLAAAARWAQVPWKRIAFYLAWTAAAVLPVANPFVSISMVLQDRYAYLALPAFALLLAEVLTGIVLRPAAAPANGQPTPPGRLLRAAGAVVAAGLVLILAVLSATRSLAWRGELVLFEDAVQHQPGCAFGHAHLATNLFFASRNLSPEARAAVLTKALRHHELAAKCADFERLIYPLQLTDERAQILWQLGRRQESCALFRQVLEGRPERPAEAGAKLRALKFLAADAVESGRLAEGLALLEDGLRLAGQDPELLINRLEVWRRLGRWEDARAEAQRLLAHPEPQVRSKAMQVLRNSRL